jgi:hypothetical protein
MLKKELEQELEKYKKNYKIYRNRHKLLTKGGKYSDIKKRIQTQKKEIKILRDSIKKEKSLITQKKVLIILRYLLEKGLLKSWEIKRIVKRYNFYTMSKRQERQADKKLDKTLTGVDKLLNKYKEEIEDVKPETSI